MPLSNANLRGQTATYRAGDPPYLELAGGTALDGKRAITTLATEQSWADGHTITVLIQDASDNWAIWHAIWNDAASTLTREWLEDHEGTLADGTAVEINMVASAASISPLPMLATPTLVGDTAHISLDGRHYILALTDDIETVQLDLPPGIDTAHQLPVAVTVIDPSGLSAWAEIEIVGSWIGASSPSVMAFDPDSPISTLTATRLPDGATLYAQTGYVEAEPPSPYLDGPTFWSEPVADALTWDADNGWYEHDGMNTWNGLEVSGSWSDDYRPAVFTCEVFIPSGAGSAAEYTDVVIEDADGNEYSAMAGSGAVENAWNTITIDLEDMDYDIAGISLGLSGPPAAGYRLRHMEFGIGPLSLTWTTYPAGDALGITHVAELAYVQNPTPHYAIIDQGDLTGYRISFPEYQAGDTLEIATTFIASDPPVGSSPQEPSLERDIGSDPPTYRIVYADPTGNCRPGVLEITATVTRDGDEHTTAAAYFVAMLGAAS